MANRFDRARLAKLADCLVIAIAVSLPWSTSATVILVVAWLLTFLPTLTWSELRTELRTWAGGLPVALVLLGALGMLWADVSWIERWKGFDSFPRLLTIPLLLAQFRRSDRGVQVLAGYLISCTVLLVATAIITAIPPLAAKLIDSFGVLVKNPATQSGEFVTCIAGLLFVGIRTIEQRRWWWLAAIVALSLGMLANIVFVSTGRTALVVLPVLVAIFAFQQLSRRNAMILIAGLVAIAAVGLSSSSYLRMRVQDVYTDIQSYEADHALNSTGQRISFYKKSLDFIRSAPVIGHGTGSIHALFEAAAAQQIGSDASGSSNPHNQTFTVAIQLGLIGAIVLWAMWVMHVMLFRARGLAEWAGLVVVVQNIIGSLFNSHLFDFGQGWLYMVGVGVAGGLALKRKASP